MATFGRRLSSLYRATDELSVFGNRSAGPSTAVIGGFGDGYWPVRGAAASSPSPATGATGSGGPTQVNNSIRYASPDLAGFKFSALYGAGEVSGSTSDTRLVNLAVRYTGQGFDAVLSYVDDKAQRGGPNDTRARTVTLAGS